MFCDYYHFFLIALFSIGYFLITIEHFTKINKTTIALLMAVLCWLIQFLCPLKGLEESIHMLDGHLSSISQVVFFLLGALTVVEIINAHKGFQIVSNAIQISSKKKLLWVTGIIAFFLSSILDNMTTTIVMVTLLSQLLDKGEERWLLGGGIVIAANAGGAWTPIGDVTTTMLWIGGQLSTLHIMQDLFLPSIVCFVAAYGVLHCLLKGNFPAREIHLHEEKPAPYATLIFLLGIGTLIFVPVFKVLTGMPPFMGMLLGLGVMWLVTDLLHAKHGERENLRVPQILSKIELSGVLFFLGILLAIDALESAGILKELALYLDRTVGSIEVIATLIGLLSAIVDNVPLVAASMSMYDLARFPTDHRFWEMVAYTAGTGGSLLIIGSAAGVVYMGLEKVHFGWYLKRISFAAAVGYFAGLAAYLATL